MILARKRSSDGFKKGKHGLNFDEEEHKEENRIRNEVRTELRSGPSVMERITPYLILGLVIGAIIGGYFIYSLVILSGEDTDCPGSSSNSDFDDFVAGVELKIETKTDGDGGHGPFDYSAHKVDPSRGTDYIILLKNRGEQKDSFKFSSNAPSGWDVTFKDGNMSIDVPANYWVYKIITIKTSSSSTGVQDIRITATSVSDNTKQDSVITKNTIEALPPGEADLNKYPAKVDYNLVYYNGGWDKDANTGEKGWYHNQGSEFEATSVIQGFQEAVKGMRVGQTLAVEVPPEKGYGINDEKHSEGRPLVFEITMLDVNSEN